MVPLTRETAQAALAVFNRTINAVDIATGEKPVTQNLVTKGSKHATHTQKAPTFPTKSGKPFKSYSLAEVKSYSKLDNKPAASSLSAI